MKFKFKLQNPDINKRKEECSKVRQKYPDRLPIIIEKDPNSQIKDIDRTKFLVPSDLEAHHLLYIVRKRLELNKEETIYMLVNGKTSISGDTPLKKIYEDFQDKEDGYLYIVYASQLAWGEL